MKLTKEQREQMWQPNTLSMLRYNLEIGAQTISNEEVVALIEDIQRLRSSEWAWKEESERLQREINSHAPEGRNYTNEQYVRMRNRFNQAIKVLKWYANAENYTYQFYYGDIDNDELEEPIKADDGQRARELLSSLQEGE